MRHIVLGTSGHIDHGKTALVNALTGIHTDRLAEEKRRGITIELGFAPWKLSEELEASIVDVPGHERLVRTMVAGAAGLDIVMLVVAADDGVMPQTREHLDVLRLLDVPAGIVVLTKCDLADDDVLELVEEDIRENVQGTFLENAPFVRTSSKSGRGMDELREVVLRLAANAAARTTDGPAFLPLDRLFTKAGFGTIGTGTMLRGTLRVGDALDAFGDTSEPISGLKVRTLQALGAGREEVTAGMRTAVNVSGRDVEALRRGMVLAGAGAFKVSESVIAWVEILDGAGELKPEELTAHLGTSERLAKVIPLGDDAIKAGESGAVLLRFDKPIASYAAQRLVLRRPGLHGQSTIGGGEVLDPEPPSGKGAVSLAASQVERLRGSPKERLAAIARESRARGISRADVLRRLPPEHAEISIRALEKKGQLTRVPGNEERWIDGELTKQLVSRVVAMVNAFHDASPMAAGLGEAEVQSQLPGPEQHLAALVVERALADKKLVRDGTNLAAPGRGALVEPEAMAEMAEILRLLEATPLTPPLEKEIAATLSLEPKRLQELMSLMRRRKEVVRIADGIHYTTAAVAEIETRIVKGLEGGKELTASEIKSLLDNMSRKWAIPVLEYLDRAHVTMRVGDVRRLHPSRR